MFGLLWSLALIIFLAILSGYFSLMEVALTESLHGKIEKLAQDDIKKLELATKFLDEPDTALSAAKIGIIFTAILSGLCTISLAEIIFAQINFFEQAEITSILIAFIFTAFVMILFGSYLPVRAAKQTPEEFLLDYQKSFKLVVMLMSPLVKIFSSISTVTMALLGMNAETSDAVTEAEVKDLIEQGTEDGTFEESEREMVDKIFHLSDQNAYSLMTPRVHMVWLDLSDGVEQNLKVVRENKQNIFPVGEGSLDEFRGVIYAKDLLDAALDNGNTKNLDLTSLIKKPIFVPRTMETFRLVEKFKSGGDSIAIVNDEYGGVVGFVTPDDIAKEIVGLKDAELPKERQFLVQKDNTWIVDGLCDIDEFKRQFDFETLPDEERDHFKTMGGFITSQFGYIPKVGESKVWNGLKFEVMEMDRARVAKILITKVG